MTSVELVRSLWQHAFWADDLIRGALPSAVDDASQAWLVEHLTGIEDNEVRAVAWLTLWDLFLDGRTTPDVLTRLLLDTLPQEPTELLAQQMLGDLETLFWRYLPEAERERLAPELEAMLWRQVTAAGSTSRKAAFFNTYRDVVSTPEALDRLERLWSGTLEVDGLPLSEDDRSTLALLLALYEVPGWPAVLDEQEASIENAERQARFAFVRPAVHPDPAVRDSVFAAFADPANRDQENWVLDATRYLNHPLRADHAERYLTPGLALVEELQRTGTIFFPRRFLDALLSGHTSPEAAVAIRSFVAEHPGYPPRLRGKILQAADPVFRRAAWEPARP